MWRKSTRALERKKGRCTFWFVMFLGSLLFSCEDRELPCSFLGNACDESRLCVMGQICSCGVCVSCSSMGSVCRSDQGCEASEQCVCGACVGRKGREKQEPTTQENTADRSENTADGGEQDQENEGHSESPMVEPETISEWVREKGRVRVIAVVAGLRGVGIEKVVARIAWGGGQQKRTADLSEERGVWSTVIEGLSEAEALSVQAEALDARGRVVASVEVGGAKVREGQEGVWWLCLRPVMGEMRAVNRAPRLWGVWVDRPEAKGGESIELRVWASDDPQERVRIVWEADVGEVKPIAEEHFRWEMAATVQAAKVRLLLRVLDDRQGKAVVSVHLPVFRVGLTEKMVFLRGPTLHNARAIRHRLQPAMTTGFEVGVEEGDGGSLRYRWSDGGGGCAGRFDDAERDQPQWTAPSQKPAQDRCMLTLRIEDQAGHTLEEAVEVGFVGDTWALGLARNQSLQHARMARTKDGDLVVVGCYLGRMDVAGLRLLDETGVDVQFVARVDEHGSVRWLLGIRGKGRHTIRAVAAAPDGDIVLWGHYTGMLEIEGRQVTSVGRADLFLARLRGDGSIRFLRTFGSVQDEDAGGLAIDAEGTVYVSGSFGGTIQLGAFQRSLVGWVDGFVGAMTAEGTWLWVHTISARFVYIRTLQVTGQKQVWAGGMFQADATLGTIKLPYKGTEYRGVVARIDPQQGWAEAEAFGEVGILDPFFWVTETGEWVLCGQFKDRLVLGDLVRERPHSDRHFFLALRGADRRWKWVRTLAEKESAEAINRGVCSALYEEMGQIYAFVGTPAHTTIMGDFVCAEQGCGGGTWQRLDRDGKWLEVECGSATESGPPGTAMAFSKASWFTVMSLSVPAYFCGGGPSGYPLGITLRKRPRILPLGP